MTGVVVVDASLMVLLVVGSASTEYIAKHKRLREDYTIEDFELLGEIIAEFSDIVLLPHILVEVSSLARQIENPARARIQDALRTLIMTATELPIQSAAGARRDEFGELGLTDAVILHLCSMSVNGILPTLITTDTDLANSAYSQGYSVIDFKQEYQTG
jgi:hypothetical protein